MITFGEIRPKVSDRPKYKVIWEYKDRVTTCKILLQPDYSLDKTYDLLAAGTITRYHTDANDKEFSRKESLKRALDSNRDEFDKNNRTMAWTAFRLMKKNPKWNVRIKR